MNLEIGIVTKIIAVLILSLLVWIVSQSLILTKLEREAVGLPNGYDVFKIDDEYYMLNQLIGLYKVDSDGQFMRDEKDHLMRSEDPLLGQMDVIKVDHSYLMLNKLNGQIYSIWRRGNKLMYYETVQPITSNDNKTEYAISGKKLIVENTDGLYKYSIVGKPYKTDKEQNILFDLSRNFTFHEVNGKVIRFEWTGVDVVAISEGKVLTSETKANKTYPFGVDFRGYNIEQNMYESLRNTLLLSIAIGILSAVYAIVLRHIVTYWLISTV